MLSRDQVGRLGNGHQSKRNAKGPTQKSCGEPPSLQTQRDIGRIATVPVNPKHHSADYNGSVYLSRKSNAGQEEALNGSNRREIIVNLTMKEVKEEVEVKEEHSINDQDLIGPLVHDSERTKPAVLQGGQIWNRYSSGYVLSEKRETSARKQAYGTLVTQKEQANGQADELVGQESSRTMACENDSQYMQPAINQPLRASNKSIRGQHKKIDGKYNVVVDVSDNRWTIAEIQMLVKLRGLRCPWRQIADRIGTRTLDSCQNMYRRLLLIEDCWGASNAEFSHEDDVTILTLYSEGKSVDEMTELFPKLGSVLIFRLDMLRWYQEAETSYWSKTDNETLKVMINCQVPPGTVLLEFPNRGTADIIERMFAIKASRQVTKRDPKNPTYRDQASSIGLADGFAKARMERTRAIRAGNWSTSDSQKLSALLREGKSLKKVMDNFGERTYQACIIGSPRSTMLAQREAKNVAVITRKNDMNDIRQLPLRPKVKKMEISQSLAKTPYARGMRDNCETSDDDSDASCSNSRVQTNPASRKRSKVNHTDSEYFPEATPFMLGNNSPFHRPLATDRHVQTRVDSGNQAASLSGSQGLTEGAPTGAPSPNVRTPQVSMKKRKRSQTELCGKAVPCRMKVES